MTQTLLMPPPGDTLPRFADEAGGIDPAGRADDDRSTAAPEAVLDDLGVCDIARPAHNLPVAPTGMLDRVWEVETARRLLGSEGVRLLTLVGPGGVGKTRVALAAAEIVLDAFPDGARFVDLAPLGLAEPGSSTRILSAIAAAIGSDPAERPPSLEHLSRRLQGRRLLLVLDNCEHLLPGLAHEVAELLAACPELSILATSREPLRLRWEHRLPVPPLGLPDPADGTAPATLLGSPAVALFVERARAVRPDFALTAENGAAVAELCRRLDGLPLAIELAAAHADVLPPAALLARLERHLPLPRAGAEDAPERHRTLEAAIRWSCELLSPTEQALFRRLGVFAGGWTLGAAEAVVDPGALGLDLLDGLLALADKSLIRPSGPEDGEVRFGMLETMREDARKQLEEAGELAETEARHAAYYLALIERTEPELRGARRAAWLGRLAREHDDLRAAQGWAAGRGDAGGAEKLGALLAALGGRSGAPAPETDPAPTGPAAGARRGNPLSEREQAVLRLVAEGLPSKQIGRELALAERTVKAHVTGAMNKLGAFTRAQAVALATRRGLLEAERSTGGQRR